MKVEYSVVGMVGTNCFFAVNEETNEIIIVDPGDNAPRLIEKIESKGYKPVAIILTHGHFDHVMAAEELSKKYGIKRYVHTIDGEVMKNPVKNVGGMIGLNEGFDYDETVEDGDELTFAGLSFKVIHTPGHTPGGVCFYFEKEGVLFSGDTLFCESVGRTDFPGSSTSALINSIREKLFKLPDLTLVYPGHGEPTKIGYEKVNNPFV